jgi:hypothetical protein
MMCPNHDAYENPQLQVRELRRRCSGNVVEWKCDACWAWWSERVVPLARVVGHWLRTTVSAAELRPAPFGLPMWMYGVRCYESTPDKGEDCDGK